MSVLGYDNFAGMDSDDHLEDHTSPSEHTWSRTSDSDAGSYITSGWQDGSVNLHDVGYGEWCVMDLVPESADYAVEADLINFYNGVNCFPSLLLRQQAGVATRYHLHWDVLNSLLVLRRGNAGSWTDLHTGTLGQGETQPHVKLGAEGALLSVFVDGDLLFSHTDSSPITDAGKGGIGFYSSAAVTAQRISTFSVTTFGGAGGGGLFLPSALDGLSCAGPTQRNPSLGAP